MSVVDETGLVRIGELSRRVGVSTHVLRAWEARYGLLRPQRSAGRFRLYCAADETRVRRMQAHLADGLSAAEAARAVLAERGVPDRWSAAAADAGSGPDVADLRSALDAMDEPGAQAVLDRLLAGFTVETVLDDVLVPYLRELGERWAAGTATVTQEHFASNVIRGRLAGLARGGGATTGPLVVLACPPQELHDLALLMHGLVLSRQGWRTCYLGADTPLEALEQTVAELRPDRVVLAATTQERFDAVAQQLARLASAVPVALGGAGADARLADRIGARRLEGGPVAAASEWPLS